MAKLLEMGVSVQSEDDVIKVRLRKGHRAILPEHTGVSRFPDLTCSSL